ncbi:50S ribosomal protein L18Ae [Methanobrevibacter filiformis]|uniref:Large ribosomal subunit protein eL20 n=1 Tax=Methanobrevibacter filiformis TaxID=55758 RepID=A0A166CRA1_9EURY|nr:50S ribosomal protein L18Ae [Methanobrevibacter filiformis]KZX16217.1 50S ribosomal protein LX [Methanobrevibacter filiformis]
MRTKIYRVQGRFIMGDASQIFTKELKAINENDIYEKIYAEFGSKHRINKNQIKLEKIDEITIDDVTDPLIKAIS